MNVGWRDKIVGRAFRSVISVFGKRANVITLDDGNLTPVLVIQTGNAESTSGHSRRLYGEVRIAGGDKKLLRGVCW